MASEYSHKADQEDDQASGLSGHDPDYRLKTLG
jgi:hypothetical protein